MIKRLKNFISEDIWNRKENDYKTRRARWFNRQIKILIFMFTSSKQHQVVIRSAALTFYSVMSVVPIMALVFGIAKGFNMETKLNEYLYREFTDSHQLIDEVIGFAEEVLERTRGGWVASIGLLVLLWAVLRVFNNVENAFNNIWEVKKQRGVARKFSDYLALIFIVPILWLISTGATIYIEQTMMGIGNRYGLSTFVEVMFGFIPFVASWIMFAFVYYMMPNANVKIGGAIRGGIIAGTALQVFQFFYVASQSGVSGYNAIYGSFAAIPLFLIWMQVSWQIVLMGAELSFAYQNVERYEFERESSQVSYQYRKKIMLVVMHKIGVNFINKQGAVSADDVASDQNLPVRIVREAIFELERAELVVAVKKADQKSNYYMPARDIHTLRVQDVIQAVERSGLQSLGMEESEDLQVVAKLMDHFAQELDKSSGNVLLMSIKDRV